jgi:hypothetical protein
MVPCRALETRSLVTGAPTLTVPDRSRRAKLGGRGYQVYLFLSKIKVKDMLCI